MTAFGSISAISVAMRLHVYPDVGVDLVNGFPFRMKAEAPSACS
jgi:hypothetical protein